MVLTSDFIVFLFFFILLNGVVAISKARFWFVLEIVVHFIINKDKNENKIVDVCVMYCLLSVKLRPFCIMNTGDD